MNLSEYFHSQPSVHVRATSSVPRGDGRRLSGSERNSVRHPADVPAATAVPATATATATAVLAARHAVPAATYAVLAARHAVSAAADAILAAASCSGLPGEFSIVF